MINYTHAGLFSQNSIKKFYFIEVYSNNSLETTITNTELYSEEIEVHRSLCSEHQLTFGSCESASITFKVINTVGSLKGKKLIVKMGFEDYLDDLLQVGEFYVDTDTLSGDRASREIVAYDKIYTIINSDVSKWYSECGLPMTLKDFRDSFFAHFGITQKADTLVNDLMVVTETVLSDIITGLDVITAICAGNGRFGNIDNEGEFVYKKLTTPSTKSYGKHYKQGSLIYEDYVVRQITGLKFYSNKATVTVGTTDNLYIMEDNFLFYNMLESDLTVYVQNIFDEIKDTPVFRPLSVETYGDFCVEVGDKVSFTNSSGQTLSTFVTNVTVKGLQSLTATYETEGSEYYEYDLSSTNSQIRRIWNNTLILQEEIIGARTYVYAHRNTKTFNLTVLPTEIIRIDLASIDESVPVFVSTIPLTMSADGEVIFKYYVDGLQIEEDEDTIYLTKGKQIVTLSTYFTMQANESVVFTVTAEVKYRESVERKQQAKILSLKDWIDNQYIVLNIQNETAEFGYDYVEQPVDTTPPTATIDEFEIRAMIFASGLASEESWGGNITVSDATNVWTIASLEFVNVTDSMQRDFITPEPIPATDTTSVWNIFNMVFDSANEVVDANLHTESFTRITEDGMTRTTEDNDTRYTEGD